MMEPLSAIARVDRRTKDLARRLKAGEIAIIDHRDLDGLSASSLVECRPAVVLNASPSISGRYPNRGPSILLNAGIALGDLNDLGVMSAVRDGQQVVVRDAELQWGGKLYPISWLTSQGIESELERARRFLGAEIEAFARNTLEYIERERQLVLDNLDIPPIRTRMANRHAVVVVRGEGFKLDLEAILPYIREVRPVLIAVDGGADALLEHDLKPDLIVGDMDSVSDAALRCGAEIVVHSYPNARKASGAPVDITPALPDGDAGPVAGSDDRSSGEAVVAGIDRERDSLDATIAAPGLARLKALGVPATVFSVAGTSEDMAMLIAHEKGAELIVAVGTHFSLVDFLDKGRRGMASTFLVRLRVGSRLVDARGVSALYQTGPGLGYTWYLLLMAACLPVAAMAVLSPGVRAALGLMFILLREWLKRHGL